MEKLHCSLGIKLYVLCTENLQIDAASSPNETTIHRHCKLLKYAYPPHFGHTTLRQKWGDGICLNIQFVSCIHACPTPYTRFLVVLCTRLTTTTTDTAWKNDSFAECVLRENSCTCAHTKTCIVSRDRGQHVSLYCKPHNFWWWPVNMAIVHVIVKSP